MTPRPAARPRLSRSTLEAFASTAAVSSPGDQATSTPTTTDAKWGHFKRPRWGHCKRPLRSRSGTNALVTSDHARDGAGMLARRPMRACRRVRAARPPSGRERKCRPSYLQRVVPRLCRCVARSLAWHLRVRPRAVTRPGQSKSSLLVRSGHDGDVTPIGVRQQQRPASSRGSIRRTAVVLADDRFDRGDGPEPACA